MVPLKLTPPRRDPVNRASLLRPFNPPRRATQILALGLMLLLSAGRTALPANLEWQSISGGRVARLTVPAAAKTGFTLVPELKGVEGIGEVKLYDTSDGVLQDLVAGRLDMAILDPPLVQYAIFQHPEWKLHQVPLDPEPDKYPIMSTKYSVIFGVNKNEPELAAAISKVIAEDIWPNCINVKTMANYGMGDKAWFVPPAVDPRAGVDRPKDYKSLTAAHCF